jgi:hypothetical protein
MDIAVPPEEVGGKDIIRSLRLLQTQDIRAFLLK